MPSDNPLLTLIEAMGNTASRDRYAVLLPKVQDALRKCYCDNTNRICMWLTQVGHESFGLKKFEEINDGSQYEGREELGNTEPGDGMRFKGRGPIMVTGRDNYTRMNRWAHNAGLVGSPRLFVDNPELLSADPYSFLGVIWYWTIERPHINEMADQGDLEGVTRAINGGLIGLGDRRTRWERCLGMGERVKNVLGHGNSDVREHKRRWE